MGKGNRNRIKKLETKTIETALMNGDINTIQQHIFQEYADKITKEMNPNTHKYCIVCGDNEDDGPIIQATTTKGRRYFCKTCHDIQMNM